jgi:hypothetical protein
MIPPAKKDRDLCIESIIDLRLNKIRAAKEIQIRIAESSLDKNKIDDSNPILKITTLFSKLLIFFKT